MMALHWQILFSLLAAFVVGVTFGGNIGGLNLLPIYELIGGLFLDALKMLIVPLVVSSIIVGMASLGRGGQVGTLAARSGLYFLLSTSLAVLLGMLLINLFQPGVVGGIPLAQTFDLAAPASSNVLNGSSHGFADFLNVIRQLIPSNIVGAAVNTQMLGLISFSLLFGLALMHIENPGRQSVLDFFSGVQDVMILLTHWVIKLAPLGVFALVAGVVAKSGLSVLLPMLQFFLVIVLGLVLHSLVSLSILLWLATRKNPLRMLNAASPALLMAFSTSSSAATLPISMDAMETRAGVPKPMASFVLPLGATINMNGTALYECAAVLFIAQAYGMDLSLTTQLLVMFLALMTAIGVAAVPSASLVAITLILGTLGLPLEAMGMILIVDRILDMFRTTVNVYSDMVGSVIVAHLAGENVLSTAQGLESSPQKLNVQA